MEWISVEDRLPPEDVLVYYHAPIFEQRDPKSNVWVGVHYGNGNFQGKSGYFGGREVTHWMPMFYPDAPISPQSS